MMNIKVKQKLSILTFIVIFEIVICHESKLINEHVCIGKDNGFFVNNPVNCHAYWTCHNEIGYYGECDEWFHFNEAHQICDLPENVPCENPPTTVIPEPTPPTIEPLDPFKCPLQGIHFFGIANDCSKYHFCFSGNHTVRQCADGLDFDIIQEKCYLPAETQCEYRSCPPIDNLNVLITHPGTQSCEDYSICQNGIPQPFKCAEGIFWNQISQQCDMPANVNCTISEPIQCPDDNQIHFIPNPSNCSEYYVCSGSNLVLRSCGSGLLFDPVKLECNKADSVQC